MHLTRKVKHSGWQKEWSKKLITANSESASLSGSLIFPPPFVWLVFLCVVIQGKEQIFENGLGLDPRKAASDFLSAVSQIGRHCFTVTLSAEAFLLSRLSAFLSRFHDGNGRYLLVGGSCPSTY